MKFYSTNRKSNPVSFREAVIKSLPEDKGLYFPEDIPELDFLFLETLEYYSLSEIGFEVMRHFTKNDIPENVLREILDDALNFNIPLVEIEKNIHSLELFHGPTYAFKDVGARFLARCLDYFNQSDSKELTILVATSGDTGGAVASGFYEVPGVNVVILYPAGKVSPLQEKQLTTPGSNIKALEIEGNFDDCQAMVKQAFLDKDLNARLNLSSANSINVARWLPQTIYYFEAWKQLKDRRRVVFAVPSGNYGNITSGMLAKKMGLEISRFIAASNANDVIPRYLEDGNYDPHPTIQTLSNAMDISDPSNHARILELHECEFKSIIKHISGFSLSDEETLKVMKACYESDQYLLDPHGAIAYQALKLNLKKKENGIFIETAHYSKFLDTVEKALGQKVALPDFVEDLMQKEKGSVRLENSFPIFKEYLMG